MSVVTKVPSNVDVSEARRKVAHVLMDARTETVQRMAKPT